MSKNSLRQIILHRTEEEKAAIELAVSDRKTVNGTTLGEESVKALKRGLFAFDENAALFIESMYSGSSSLNKAVGNALNFVSAGVNWEPRYKGSLPLVEFARNNSIANDGRLGKEYNRSALHHAKKYFPDLILFLDKHLNKKSYINKANLEKDIAKLKKIYAELEKTPRAVSFPDVYDIIIRNWSILENWQVTYRILMDLPELEDDWRTTVAIRMEFTSLLQELSLDWMKQDADFKETQQARRLERQANNNEEIYREVAICNAHLIVPNNAVVINPDVALESEAAFILRFVNYNDYLRSKFGPHPALIYLVSKKGLEGKDLDECIGKAQEVWPPIKAVKLMHISCEGVGLDDEILAPIIRESPDVFPEEIPDISESPDGGYLGAVLVRHNK